MSTPNFHKVHARKYYVVGDEITCYDEELDEDVPCLKDSDDYDMDIEFAVDRAIEKGYEKAEGRNYVRTMDGSRIIEKEVWHCFGKKSNEMPFNQILIRQEIYAHNGYYSGFNYDWDLFFETNMGDTFRLSEYDDVDSLVDDIADAWQEEASDTWNAGLAKMQRKNFTKWLSKVIEKVSDEADDLCRDVCEGVYVCGGIFSNGEAVYYKENNAEAA